jgi:glycine/D-amino acid oxidase-like deaminating enzyme
MPITVDPVESDRQLPEHADVVIIGGGIIGVSTALFLAERGVSTLLCEKGVIAGEQSGRNWGWCRTMGRDPRELPLALKSLELWKGINARIGAETGFRTRGTFYICPDEASYKKREAWLPHARSAGLDCRLLAGDAVKAVLPGAKADWRGGLHTPGDGVAEPQMAAPAIAEAARKRGAVIMTGCAVRSIERQGGRVSAVETEKGRVRCGAVVVAGGVWSSLFLRALGIRLPQLKVLASVFRTSACPDGPETAAWGPGLALRRRLDGGYTVSEGMVVAEIVPDSFRFLREFMTVLRMEHKGIKLRVNQSFLAEARHDSTIYEKSRMLDPPVWQQSIDIGWKNLTSTFPAFASTSIVQSWSGYIDATPDLLPVISPCETVPGLFVSSGYSGHGFGIGLGAGHLTADLVSGATPVVDPAPFRLARFTDGSTVKPLAGL